MKILQVDFPSKGPFGAEMSTAMRELAESIAEEPGLIWKLWTEKLERHHGCKIGRMPSDFCC